MAYYCAKHSIDHESFDCPRCAVEERHEEILDLARDREREAERRHEEAQEREEERQREAERSREEALHKQANPGDYQCPGCGFQTLKRGFPRCTRCQWDVAPDYWPGIFERERKQSEERARRERIAAEEWAKGEPERQRLAKAAAEASAKAAAERATTASRAASARRWAEFLEGAVTVHFAYLLPILGWGTSMLVFSVTDVARYRASPAFGWDMLLLFVPVVNWLGYLGLLFLGGSDRPLAWAITVAWASVGAFVYWTARTLAARR